MVVARTRSTDRIVAAHAPKHLRQQRCRGAVAAAPATTVQRLRSAAAPSPRTSSQSRAARLAGATGSRGAPRRSSEALAIGVAPADGALVLRRSEEEIAVGIKLETREGTLVTGEQDGALRVGEGGWGRARGSARSLRAIAGARRLARRGTRGREKWGREPRRGRARSPPPRSAPKAHTHAHTPPTLIPPARAGGLRAPCCAEAGGSRARRQLEEEAEGAAGVWAGRKKTASRRAMKLPRVWESSAGMGNPAMVLDCTG